MGSQLPYSTDIAIVSSFYPLAIEVLLRIFDADVGVIVDSFNIKMIIRTNMRDQE